MLGNKSISLLVIALSCGPLAVSCVTLFKAVVQQSVYQSCPNDQRIQKLGVGDDERQVSFQLDEASNLRAQLWQRK